MTFAYLTALLLSLAGLAMLDFRFRLALSKDPVRGFSVLGVATAFFLTWDALGIALGIFFRGQTAHLTGILVAPEIPLEEVFFLVVLSYTTLIVFTAFEKMRSERK